MIFAPTRYDSRAGAGPMCTASSAIRTWRALASASEKTATVAIPIRRAVLMTRHAISPRLAIRILVNMVASPRSHPEHAELRRRNRRIQRRREREPEHAARLRRIDHAVVPQP